MTILRIQTKNPSAHLTVCTLIKDIYDVKIVNIKIINKSLNYGQIDVVESDNIYKIIKSLPKNTLDYSIHYGKISDI